MSLKDSITALKQEIEHCGIRPENGLGTELFHFSSTLAPVVNVDLLIFNTIGQVLLSWRDDPYCGSGWHIPGSCIRFQESMSQCILRCAKEEIGVETIAFSSEPIKVYEFIIAEQRKIEDQHERGHFISLVYKCLVSDSFQPNNYGKQEKDVGFLKWFDELPENLLYLQECYRTDWEELIHGGR